MLVLAGCATRADFAVPPPPQAVAPRREEALPPVPPSPLTAEEAVGLALERNPDLLASRARVASALAALDAAEAALRPVLATEVQVLGGDAPSAYLFKTIDARNLAPATDFNDPGSFYNVEAGAALRWNLWNGGRDVLARWAAESAVEESRHGRDALANALVAGVVAAHLGGRAARELLAADEASVRTVEAQVEETRARVEGGSALRSDLLSLEVRLKQAEERRIRADVAHRLVLAALRRLLALEPGHPLDLADAAYPVGDLPGAATEALEEAYRRRGEVQAARRAVERARIEVERAERATSPRADLEARYYGDDEGLSLDANWTVALALSFEVFDGGRRKAGVRSARAALERIEEEDRRALLEVARDVEEAYLHLEEAEARVAVASQAVGAGEETLDLVDRQFRGGSATVTRYLEAEQARTEARTALIRARLDLERARLDVARALGRLGAPAEEGE
jgi:outer membrane protein TolC